jgi:type I restriction enzyme R subunit
VRYKRGALQLNPQYLTKKKRVFENVMSFVEKFKGVGGQL